MPVLSNIYKNRALLSTVLLCAYAIFLYVFFFMPFMVFDVKEGVVVTALVLFPLTFGVATQVIGDPYVARKFATVFWWACLVFAGISLLLLILEFETVICIVLAIPLFLPLFAVGIWGARAVLRLLNARFDGRKLHSILLLLPLSYFLAEGQFTYPYEAQFVKTEIVIDAPVAEVWTHTVEIPEIQPNERIWTFSHRVLRTPMAVDAVVDGDLRDLRWTKGVRFQERIRHRDEGRYLAWDFEFPDGASLVGFDPHLTPKGAVLNLTDGFYRLDPMGDGRTKLTLETHYTVHSPMNWYLALWGDLFLSDFHKSVLFVIKTRSEAAQS
ncbi:MAG: SRPBCC family protein [Halocynthiibacter sp.]